MHVMAQMAMVMNLDKCIGCHTCSVTCKQAWTNRPGTEYMWWNNVETKPGVGYPRRWEDQQRWQGGWKLDRAGKPGLKAGGRLQKLLTIFSNPRLPMIDDFYEPWTYGFERLIDGPLQDSHPTVRPRSELTGRDLNLKWGPNWDDNLAGGPSHAALDPNFEGMQEMVRLDYEHVFLFYLPRICEHCLNPSCVASCPSGAMYKRVEDGIVLVDQDQCRGWRFCVSGCPYKKVYFNYRTGKAEKCILCYPRTERGMSTICSETCVGRLRHMGLVLYDVDRVPQAVSTLDPKGLLDAHLDLLLDPTDPAVRRQARADGIHEDWLDAAARSPVYKLAKVFGVALPIHPEFRTLPMVWYVPPLSPVIKAVDSHGESDDAEQVFHAIDELRIPAEFLAGLFTAGDTDRIRLVLKRLTAMRSHMRARQLGQPSNAAAAVGMSEQDMQEMFSILAIGKYEDRYVIPPGHRDVGDDLREQQGSQGLSFRGGPSVTQAEGYVTGGDGSHFLRGGKGSRMGQPPPPAKEE